MLKLDARDFIPGKNPIGDMATVHIPIKNILWLAHSGSERLDVGLAGGVVHLLQREGTKDKATKSEIARAKFNKAGSAYWVENDVNALYEKLETHLKLNFQHTTDELEGLVVKLATNDYSKDAENENELESGCKNLTKKQWAKYKRDFEKAGMSPANIESSKNILDI